MKKVIVVLVISVFFLSLPPVALAGERENAALNAYKEALKAGDLKKLDSLLATNFEYRYYKDGRLEKITREDEFNSLSRIFKAVMGETFSEREEFGWTNSNKYNMQFVMIFRDTEKMIATSFFSGAVLEIDEKLTVVLNGNKIKRLIEEKDRRRKYKMSFGFLKSIHLDNTDYDSTSKGAYTLFRLYDVKSHGVLLIKKETALEQNTEDRFYWPENHKIENINNLKNSKGPGSK